MDESPQSPSSLARYAGVIALLAGTFFVVTDLGRYPLRADKFLMVTNPLLMAVNAAYFFAFVGLMVALIAVHGRLAASLGRFGLVAFLFAVLGVITQGGNMWFDGFAVPWLAEVLPQVFTAPKTLSLQIGGLLSYVLFALGWVLYGLAALRAGRFRWGWRSPSWSAVCSATTRGSRPTARRSGWPSPRSAAG